MLLDTSFIWFHYKFNKHLSKVIFNVPDVLFIFIVSTLFKIQNSHKTIWFPLFLCQPLGP